MTDNITSFKKPDVPFLGMTEDGMLSMLINHIRERELIELDDDFMQDVDLIPHEPDEKYLGSLTLTESTMFAIAMFAQEIIQDVMIEAQAQTAEEAARLIRQQKSRQTEVPPESTILSDEDRIYVNELSVVFRLAQAAYEFSIRKRFDCYDKFVIVRDGFTAYTKG